MPSFARPPLPLTISKWLAMPGRKEAPIVPNAPYAEFAMALRALRANCGKTYRQLAKKDFVGATALCVAASGQKLPSLAVTLAFVRACDGSEAEWKLRWHAAARRPPPDRRES